MLGVGGVSQAAELLALAEAVAREAGALVHARRQEHAVPVSATKSSRYDIVTESDTAAEQLIRDRLLSARPGDGLLGEEGGRTPSRSGITWVVDPIDGTVNYYYGIPWYAVSIAAEDADGGLVGVVHNPATGETWTAIRGQGAWLDGVQLRLAAAVDLANALVATGFAYETDRRENQVRLVSRLLPQVRDIRRMGAASLDLCSVATGRVDAYYEQGLQPWDIAAGALVATQAGASVQRFTSDGTDGEILLSAAEPLAGQVRQTLRDTAED